MNDGDIKVVGLSSNQTKGKTNWKIIGAIIGIVVLAVGVVAGILLVRQDQNIEEKAACVAACPNSSGILINCYNSGETDGSQSICNLAGRVEVCGQNASNARQYCCPAAGGTWTTNMTACAVATPTATTRATATSTSTATTTSTSSSASSATATSTTKATATSKATSTAKASSTATAVPIPVTGASLPTIIGGGFGIVMILVSLALAL